MRIGVVCPYTFDVPGGVQAHVRELADALLHRGHEVSVLAPSDGEIELPPYVEPAGRAIPVRFNGAVARLQFGPRSAARVRRWVREGGFDVLHLHEPLIPSLSLLACWAANGPIVATFHADMGRSRVLSGVQAILQPSLEKITARIAVSEHARDTIVHHLGGDAVLIPNGVTVRSFAGSDLLPGWGGPGEVLGFLGRLDEPRKGLTVLLAAFARLAERRPGLRLLLAGPGDADVVDKEIPAALRGRVSVLGAIAEADKARMFRSADVFVAPNIGGESFGVILLESMAAGTPVLASDLDAFRTVLDGGAAGAMFRKGDPNDLARAAAALLDDPARRAQLVARGRQVVQRYDWDTVVRDVLSVYGTVVRPGSPVREDRRSRLTGRTGRVSSP